MNNNFRRPYEVLSPKNSVCFLFLQAYVGLSYWNKSINQMKGVGLGHIVMDSLTQYTYNLPIIHKSDKDKCDEVFPKYKCSLVCLCIS